MDKPLIILFGESGSGKSSIAEALCEEYQLKEVKTYTTRQPRFEGENTHIFTTKDEYDKLKEKGSIVAETCFAGNYYFTTIEQLENSDIVVWDIDGIKCFDEIENHRPYMAFYIKVSKESRCQRMKERGDSIANIKARLEHDANKFCLSDLNKYYVIDNEKEINESVNEIYRLVQYYSLNNDSNNGLDYEKLAKKLIDKYAHIFGNSLTIEMLLKEGVSQQQIEDDLGFYDISLFIPESELKKEGEYVQC